MRCCRLVCLDVRFNSTCVGTCKPKLFSKEAICFAEQCILKEGYDDT